MEEESVLAKEIVDILQNERLGLHVQKIAMKLGKTRNTTAIALALLQGMGIVKYQMMGKSKVYYISEELYGKKVKI